MKISLELNQKNSRVIYELHSGEKVKIGRNSNCDWVIKDEKVSSFHCCFFFRENRLEIVDLKSKNGTFLNGIKIESADFFIGDHIKIGDSTIWLRKTNADAEAISILTFPGPINNLNGKIIENLTSVRISNQLFKGSLNEKVSNAPNPIFPGKNHQSKSEKNNIVIKVSIKKKYRNRILMAYLIDIQLFALSSLLLFYCFRLLQISITHHFLRLAIFSTMQISGMALIFFLNHRFTKFTIGEKIMGLPSIYSREKASDFDD
jgi:hypothetical protein